MCGCVIMMPDLFSFGKHLDPLYFSDGYLRRWLLFLLSDRCQYVSAIIWGIRLIKECALVETISPKEVVTYKRSGTQ